ncbi:hypothetical protein [Nonomuraea candida]|nr:hypothetical protein [Nonomuraea candida]
MDGRTAVIIGGGAGVGPPVARPAVAAGGRRPAFYPDGGYTLC